jgi:hypothetical protein
VHHFHAWVDYLARGRHYDCLEWKIVKITIFAIFYSKKGKLQFSQKLTPSSFHLISTSQSLSYDKTSISCKGDIKSPWWR